MNGTNFPEVKTTNVIIALVIVGLSSLAIAGVFDNPNPVPTSQVEIIDSYERNERIHYCWKMQVTDPINMTLKNISSCFSLDMSQENNTAQIITIMDEDVNRMFDEYNLTFQDSSRVVDRSDHSLVGSRYTLLPIAR